MPVSGFVPRMDSTIDGVSVIGELRCRSWDGVVADVWDVACAADARGSYVSGHPRLFIPLEKSGAGDFVVAARPDLPAPRDAVTPCQISYIPADMPLWGRGSGAHRLRHLDLHFDVDALARRLGEDLDAVALATPRLMFSDDRLLSLARLIATECDRPQGLHDLYGDGLAVALFIDLMQIQRRPQRQRSPLAPWQGWWGCRHPISAMPSRHPPVCRHINGRWRRASAGRKTCWPAPAPPWRASPPPPAFPIRRISPACSSGWWV